MGILKRLSLLIRYRFPSKLPTGMTEFEDFVQSILVAYKLPDLPSYKNAVATMIMHLSPQQSYAPKAYFAKGIRKSMANQIAYSKIQEYKKLEEEREKAEEKAVEQKAS